MAASKAATVYIQLLPLLLALLCLPTKYVCVYFYSSVHIQIRAMDDMEVIAATALCLQSLNNYISTLKKKVISKNRRRRRQRRWWMTSIHYNRMYVYYYTYAYLFIYFCLNATINILLLYY